jgi:hypothetical protein
MVRCDLIYLIQDGDQLALVNKLKNLTTWGISLLAEEIFLCQGFCSTKSASCKTIYFDVCMLV